MRGVRGQAAVVQLRGAAVSGVRQAAGLVPVQGRVEAIPVMKVHVFHHYMRPWPRPKNHLDVRVCPTCAVPVHGDEGQRAHHEDHLRRQERDARVNGWLEEFARRTGVTEEEFGSEWSWGAEVEGTEGEIESAEEA